MGSSPSQRVVHACNGYRSSSHDPDDRSEVQSPTHTTDRRTRVAIVGTGFAGLGMAIRLRQEGMSDFVVL
ncbi:MAG TPA: hypothetical protein VIG64_11360, partial [Actinomycetota bacterium]